MAMLISCDADAFALKTVRDIDSIDGLVLPGGESTTIGKLLSRFGLFDELGRRMAAGLPVMGTCAGLILLAQDLVKYDQPRFGVLDVEVTRNAYGPQIESFEADIHVPEIGGNPVRAVFIRAPVITRIGKGVEVLASFEDSPVIVRQGKILGLSFHPELTDDSRIHEYFISLI
ncbi:MAG: pyridoxal 5'-phosphate synthase glutaminase subunit PdxT [Spirochaetaceae bacterium]|nr:MAG: pyridoxal 5'-phosphate synthase glutaminase subunit PdxT [Spirochaetaceae bacterium]